MLPHDAKLSLLHGLCETHQVISYDVMRHLPRHACYSHDHESHAPCSHLWHVWQAKVLVLLQCSDAGGNQKRQRQRR